MSKENEQSICQILGNARSAFINILKLFQRRRKICGNLFRQLVGFWQVVGVLKTFVSQPEDVKADLVTLHEFMVGERLKPLGLFPDTAVSGVVAGDEIVEVGVAHRFRLQCEPLIGSEIVNPQFLRPRGFAGGFAIEEQHVCLDALCVKDTRRESEQRMDIAFVQQFLADGLTRSSFKQDVIRHDNRRRAVDFQNRFDVLKEVELFVGGGRPEILPFVDERVFPRTPFFIHNCDAAFLAKGWIRQHYVVALARIRDEAVPGFHGTLVSADTVEVQVHHAKPDHAVHNIRAVKGLVSQEALLCSVKPIAFLGKVVIGSQEKSAGAACRIADGLHRLRFHHLHNRLNQGTGREVLTGAAFGIFSVLLQQTFVDVPFHIGIQAAPGLIIDELNDALEFGRVLNLVLRFSEDYPQRAALLA